MFLILVVLYNKTVSSSTTLRGVIKSSQFLNSQFFKLLLWDNSYSRIINSDFYLLQDSFNDFDYVHTPQNLSLVSIYNNAIEIAIAEKSKYLLLLDDDSQISEDYFRKVFDAAILNAPLILAIVKNNGVTRSPMKSYVIKNFFIKNLKPGFMSSENLVAINSGMVISVDFITKYLFRYSTQLISYGSDNYFMRFYSKVQKQVYIIDFVINHSLSFFDTGDINKKIKIFRESKRSNLIVYSDNWFSFLLAYLYNFMSSLKNALQYRNFQFLR